MNLEIKIKDLMKSNPLKVSPDESLASVSKKMAKKGKDMRARCNLHILMGMKFPGKIFKNGF